MFKKILLAVVVAFSFIACQNVFAEGWGCGEGMKKMVGSLSMDAAQKEKIKPILEQLKSSMQTNITQMKDLHTQITQQVQSDTMDQSAMDNLIDSKTKLIGNMMKAKIMAQHQIFMLLTPVQKAKYNSMLQRVEAKWAERGKRCDAQDSE